MEALNRGNRLLRNQSQEWRQDSSSDNEEDLRANAKAAAQGMSMSHHHEYEEPRNVVEARKISLGECEINARRDSNNRTGVVLADNK